MTKDQAKPIILAEMRRRLADFPYTGEDGGLVEFTKPQNERPELFEFRSAAGQWTLVDSWLRNAGMVP